MIITSIIIKLIEIVTGIILEIIAIVGYVLPYFLLGGVISLVLSFLVNCFKDKDKNIKLENYKYVIQSHTLRTTTTLLFFTACIICGISWLLYEKDPYSLGFSGYGNILYFIAYSDGAMAIVCAIMAIMLAAKVDTRFLCVPIITESIRWFLTVYYIIQEISDFKNFTIQTYACAFCAISTIPFLLLLFLGKDKKEEYPTILYTIPGICRMLFAISWFINSNQSPLNVEETEFIYSLFLFFGNERTIFSIALIFLGRLIQQLSAKKTKSKATIL